MPLIILMMMVMSVMCSAVGMEAKRCAAESDCSTDYKQLWEVLTTFGPLVILLFILIQYVASYCCKPFGVASLGNNLDLEMVEAGISTASVPPTPSYIPEINKREHEDVDTNLVPRIERQILPPIHTRRPGQARPFQPPYYVKIDPTYDPDTGPTYPPTDISNKK